MLISFEYVGFFPACHFVFYQQRRHNLFVFRLAWIILTFYHNNIRICNYSGNIVMFRLPTAVFFLFFCKFLSHYKISKHASGPALVNTSTVVNLRLQVMEVC